jgi:hypothetical protein
MPADGRFFIKTKGTMTQTEITINGKTYPVIFTLATLSNFEEIANKAFFNADLDMVKNRIALIRAAAIAANENTKLTVEDLRGNETLEDYRQISTAYTVVTKLAGKFFHIPEIEKGNGEEQPSEEEGEKPKN